MPSIVPPGYTRGPILFIGQATAPRSEERLIQTFWDLAGGYGARLTVISLDPASEAAALRIQALLVSWETEAVDRITWHDRGRTVDSAMLGLIERSTGILLIADSARRATAMLGGTDLAQAIRRKNARNTAVCGMGPGGVVISQHIVNVDIDTGTGPDTGSLRGGISFLPGLGLINRLTIVPVAAAAPPESGPDQNRVPAHLARIVAHNPFLIAAAVPADSGLAVFPDSTLQSFGGGEAVVVQQRDLPADSWDADGLPQTPEQPDCTRFAGETRYCMDTHRLLTEAEADDMPGESYSTSAF